MTGLPLAIEQTLQQQGVSWLPRPIPLGNHNFLDQNGTVTDINALQGRWNLAFFGFTFCPDVCPMTLSQLTRARRQAQQLSDSTAAKTGLTHPSSMDPVQIVLISTDPERDKPAALKPYLSYFAEDIVGLTGNPGSLAKISTELHAFYAKVEQPDAADGQGYTMDHSANIVVISPTGDYLGYISPPHSVAQLTAIIQTLGQLRPDTAPRSSFTTNVIDWIRFAQK